MSGLYRLNELAEKHGTTEERIAAILSEADVNPVDESTDLFGEPLWHEEAAGFAIEAAVADAADIQAESAPPQVVSGEKLPPIRGVPEGPPKAAGRAKSKASTRIIRGVSEEPFLD